jgi:hypothetical protein
VSQSKQLAAEILDAAPDLHALIPEDVPDWLPITGIDCDECDKPAGWFGNSRILCADCRKRAEAQ